MDRASLSVVIALVQWGGNHLFERDERINMRSPQHGGVCSEGCRS